MIQVVILHKLCVFSVDPDSAQLATYSALWRPHMRPRRQLLYCCLPYAPPNGKAVGDLIIVAFFYLLPRVGEYTFPTAQPPETYTAIPCPGDFVLGLPINFSLPTTITVRRQSGVCVCVATRRAMWEVSLAGGSGLSSVWPRPLVILLLFVPSYVETHVSHSSSTGLLWCRLYFPRVGWDDSGGDDTADPPRRHVLPSVSLELGASTHQPIVDR
jgi:hypothetical protein